MPSVLSQWHQAALENSHGCATCEQECGHSSQQFPRDVKPISTATVDGGLSIEWSNQHRSFYPAEVLERSSYDPPLHAPHDDTRTPWTSDISSSPPSVEYASIMSKQDESGAGVLQLLDEIVRLTLLNVLTLAQAGNMLYLWRAPHARGYRGSHQTHSKHSRNSL